MIRSGDLDKRVQFRRYSKGDDGFQKRKFWEDLGSTVWAKKTDVRDGEKFSGAEVAAFLTSRFVVRSTSFTRGITVKDAISISGTSFDILGIKEIGRNAFLEITAGTEVNNRGE